MNVIVVDELTVPKDVEIIKMKSSTIFKKDSRKAILKRHSLEVTNPVKRLGVRLKTYTPEVVLSSHLGVIRGIVPHIKGNEDLNKILKKYFQSKKD